MPKEFRVDGSGFHFFFISFFFLLLVRKFSVFTLKTLCNGDKISIYISGFYRSNGIGRSGHSIKHRKKNVKKCKIL